MGGRSGHFSKIKYGESGKEGLIAAYKQGGAPNYRQTPEKLKLAGAGIQATAIPAYHICRISILQTTTSCCAPKNTSTDKGEVMPPDDSSSQ